jgi:hypothetical protein
MGGPWFEFHSATLTTGTTQRSLVDGWADCARGFPTFCVPFYRLHWSVNNPNLPLASETFRLADMHFAVCVCSTFTPHDVRSHRTRRRKIVAGNIIGTQLCAQTAQ